MKHIHCPKLLVAKKFINNYILGTGTAEDPCLLQYAGPEPFSEPETRAFANFVNGKDITMYITLHSYGQVLLYPYGYTWRDVENVKDYVSFINYRNTF